MQTLYLSIFQSMDTTGYRVLVSLLAILVSIVVINKVNKAKLNTFIGEKIKYFAAGVFISGIIIYTIGFWDEGSKGNILTLLFRSTLSSLEMFVSHSDLVEVRHSMHENALYMFLFALIHFLAVFLSAILILPLIAYIGHSQRVLRKMRAERLYIFWGESDNCFLLAEDIIRTQKDDNYRILLFIETPSDKHSEGSIHFTHLFSGSLVKNECMERISKMGALMLAGKVTQLKCDEEQNFADVLTDAGLSSLYRSICKNDIKDIKFFFLSDNYEENVKNSAALIFTREQPGSPMLGKKVEVFCHSDYSDLCLVYNYASMYNRHVGENNVTFTVVDSSRLSVAELKSNPLHHPVRFVEVDTSTATARSPFTAIVAGMDHTGHEALKYLYEFGSMLGADGKKNPLKIYALSSESAKLPSQFYLQQPALRGNPEVELLPGDSSSPHFWQWMEEVIDKVNCVVVTTGDDKSNLQFAIDTLRLACRKRTDNMRNFKIFVRSYLPKYQKELTNMAAYYQMTNPEWDNPIVVFGCRQELFTHRNVIGQEAVFSSIAFYDQWAKLTGAEDWMSRFVRLSRTYAQHTEFASLFNQDMSCYWHTATKAHLAGITPDAEGQQRLHELLQCAASRPDMTAYAAELARCATREERAAVADRHSRHQGPDTLQTLLANLAKTEHLRWAALMETMGFTPYYDHLTDGDPLVDDIRARKISRLVDLDTLLAVPSLRETLPYTHSVVDVSLMMLSQANERR